MQVKLGRFAGCLPDKDPFDTILFIISRSAPKKGMKFESPIHKCHRFFSNMKEQYPQLFPNLHFTKDPDFPYSEELSDCLTRLQEYGYVSRPNPSLSEYLVNSNHQSMRIKIDSSFSENLVQVAAKFKEEFGVQDDKCSTEC
ncbi:MAG: hypothetical protein ACOWWM_18475 [Desulfobacterales bacterium]